MCILNEECMPIETPMKDYVFCVKKQSINEAFAAINALEGVGTTSEPSHSRFEAKEFARKNIVTKKVSKKTNH